MPSDTSAPRPPRDTADLDNRRAVKVLVSDFDKLLAKANTTFAHLALIAGRETLSITHKDKLGHLHAELVEARKIFDAGVDQLPEAAKIDSRLLDTRNAFDQLTMICRSLM